MHTQAVPRSTTLSESVSERGWRPAFVWGEDECQTAGQLAHTEPTASSADGTAFSASRQWPIQPSVNREIVPVQQPPRVVQGTCDRLSPFDRSPLVALAFGCAQVVIPRATREAAPVFLIQITFMFGGVDPDGVFLRYATQSHTCSADLLDSSTHVIEGHVKRANAGTSLLTDARETLQPELDVG